MGPNRLFGRLVHPDIHHCAKEQLAQLNGAYMLTPYWTWLLLLIIGTFPYTRSSALRPSPSHVLPTAWRPPRQTWPTSPTTQGGLVVTLLRKVQQKPVNLESTLQQPMIGYVSCLGSQGLRVSNFIFCSRCGADFMDWLYSQSPNLNSTSHLKHYKCNYFQYRVIFTQMGD